MSERKKGAFEAILDEPLGFSIIIVMVAFVIVEIIDAIKGCG